MTQQFSRRLLVAAAGMAALPTVVGCSGWSGLAGANKIPDLTSRKENLEGMLRMTASLAEEDVPWWFDGTIFGILGENEPKPLVRFEGWEIYWVRPLGDGAYELTGHTVTFFCDVETGKMLDTFDNPYTGKRNNVTASVQGGGAGFGFNYSVNGVRPTKFVDKMPDKPLQLQWSMVRDAIWMHAETAYPPGMKQPRKQRQTIFTQQANFADRSILKLPAVFTATVFGNWPRWMDMGNHPGHVIWHASGAKLDSINDLSPKFRERLERDHPDRTTAYPFSGAKKISDFT